MLEEKGLNTFVKLNPTLLGYARVREILDVCGFGYIGLKEESFDHDLKLTQALEMLERLMALAKEKSLGFGVKLTNTPAPLITKAHCLVKRCICQAVRCSALHQRCSSSLSRL